MHVSKNNGAVAVLDDEPDALIATVLQAAQDEKNEKKKPSEEQLLRDAVTALLGKLGERVVQDDALLFEGSKFVLPSQYDGANGVERAIDFLINHIKQQKQPFNFNRIMKARPYDGAHGFMEVMKTLTGTTGFGKTVQTMFGPKHPEFVSVNVGVDRVVQVPWGDVEFPMYEATFHLGATVDDDWGLLFKLSVTAPRKWRKHIEGIFSIIEKHITEHSIYKGQAINGSQMPEFIDVDSLDPETVVYNANTLAQLNAHVWSGIRYSDEVRKHRGLNRKVLFAGPFGTGKTLGCTLTGQIATHNGWTFLMCRPGKDNPREVMQTAALYAPAVVIVEDLDVHAEGGTKADISKLLDSLDGLQGKGKEIICVFTTNYIDQIQKGALRPGRIDGVIEIGELDEPAFRKLVTLVVQLPWLADEVDWAKVAKGFKGFLPAFVKEAAQRAQMFAMAENEGRPGLIGTEDLINAADSLRPQLEYMIGANEGANKTTVDDLVRETIEGALNRTSNENIGQLCVEEYDRLATGK